VSRTTYYRWLREEAWAKAGPAEPPKLVQPYEALEGEELTDYLQAVKVIARLIRWYNEERLHSALGFLRPKDYYRGEPLEMYAVRREKLAGARHRRREKNLQLRQPTLPFTSEETVA
jgi:hypothetical protein